MPSNHLSHITSAVCLLGLLHPDNAGHEGIGNHHHYQFAFGEVLQLFLQDFSERDVEKGACGHAHEEGHHEAALSHQETASQQSSYVHESLQYDHKHGGPAGEACLLVEESEGQALCPLVHQDGSGQTEHAYDTALQSHCQCLEEGVDGHARLQYQRLPVTPLLRLGLCGKGTFLLVVLTSRSLELIRMRTFPMLHLHTPVPIRVLLGTSGEGDLVLVVVGVSDEYLIEEHDEDECDHGDDHGEGEFAAVEDGALVDEGGGGEELVEVGDGFGDDVDECDGEEERAREGHSQLHDSLAREAVEGGDAVAEDGDFEEEDGHQHHLRSPHPVHHQLNYPKPIQKCIQV